MVLRQYSRERQSGAALILALIFLLLMTMLSTSSMRGATMQERMAGNMRDWNLGFQSAEAALREAEASLLNATTMPDFNDADGYYELNSPDRPVWVGTSPDPGNGSVALAADTIPDVAEQPHYYIEKLAVQPAGMSTEIPTSNDIYYFRITAVGYGGATDGTTPVTPLTSVVLQSVYRSR